MANIFMLWFLPMTLRWLCGELGRRQRHIYAGTLKATWSRPCCHAPSFTSLATRGFRWTHFKSRGTPGDVALVWAPVMHPTMSAEVSLECALSGFILWDLFQVMSNRMECDLDLKKGVMSIRLRPSPPCRNSVNLDSWTWKLRVQLGNEGAELSLGGSHWAHRPAAVLHSLASLSECHVPPKKNWLEATVVWVCTEILALFEVEVFVSKDHTMNHCWWLCRMCRCGSD